jgi:hypothetical protein
MTTIIKEKNVFFYIFLLPRPPPPPSADSVIMAASFLLSRSIFSLCVYSIVHGWGWGGGGGLQIPTSTKSMVSFIYSFSMAKTTEGFTVYSHPIYCSKVNMFFYMLESSFFVFLSSSSKRAKKNCHVLFDQSFYFRNFSGTKLLTQNFKKKSFG